MTGTSANTGKRLRVAHLIYSPSVGGSEMVAADICSRLDPAAFDPMVLFMYNAKGQMKEILKGRGIRTFNFRHNGLRRLTGPVFPALALSRLKIDVLHVHHIPLLTAVLPAVRLSKIPVIVLTEHAKFSISRSARLQEACRMAARTVACFTAVSHDLKRYFTEELHVPSESIDVIHNGVDTGRFVSGAMTGRLKALVPQGFNGPVMTTTGRLTDAKDHVTLFSALKMLISRGHSPHLVIIGDGELRGELEKKADEMGLKARMTFAGSRRDVDELLRGSTVFALSSKREGLPLAVLEAMASGITVVATSVGAIPEVIDHGVNGMLVPPQNPVALADALDSVLRDSALRLRLGKGARQRIEGEFSLDTVVRKYSSLYMEHCRKAKGEDANRDTLGSRI